MPRYCLTIAQPPLNEARFDFPKGDCFELARFFAAHFDRPIETFEEENRARVQCLPHTLSTTVDASLSDLDGLLSFLN